MHLLFLDLGTGEILLIILAIFLVFGPGKIPQMARGLGKFVGEIKRASEDVKNEINREADRIEREEKLNEYKKKLDLDGEAGPAAKKKKSTGKAKAPARRKAPPKADIVDEETKTEVRQKKTTQRKTTTTAKGSKPSAGKTKTTTGKQKTTTRGVKTTAGKTKATAAKPSPRGPKTTAKKPGATQARSMAATKEKTAKVADNKKEADTTKPKTAGKTVRKQS